MGRSQLSNVLSTAGQPVESFESPDGSVALALPHGGRVIGLFAPESEENFFWTNPALDTADGAEALFASDAWHNSGGERTWLGPEIDLFFPNYPNREFYFQPRGLDPGHYRIERDDNGFRLVNRATVTLFRRKVDIDVVITKRLSPAPNPLRYEGGMSFDGVQYAGCTVGTRLEVTGDGQVGLWSLTQLPHGGELIVPTYGRCEPLTIFGTIPDGALSVTDRMVCYKMDHPGDAKIGIRAAVSCGRVGYLSRSGPNWSLVVRNFSVNPSGDYVDVPWEDENDFGYAIQACNLSGDYGVFSELEYHAPAIGKGTGLASCEDRSQVWAFRGTEEKIRAIAGQLLSFES